jgi:two-component system, chemotaxis family, sensor kinase CheA
VSADDPIAAFRVEAGELLDQVEQGLLDLTHRLGDMDLVNAVFRGLHTLKGSGAMFGFDALAGFTHHCETAFDRVRKGQVPATPALVGVILSAQDHMRGLVEGNASESEGAAILASLQEAVDAASGGAAAPAKDAAPAAPASATTAVAQAAGWNIRFRLPPDSMANGTNPLMLLDELRELGSCTVVALTDQVPPLPDLNPTHCHIGWDVTLMGDVSRDAIDDVFIFVMDDMELTVTPIADAAEPAAVEEAAPTAVVEAAVAPSAAPPAAANDAAAARTPVKADESVRVPAALRDTMMVLRMVPVASLFGRFRRLIHDLARDTGKNIVLVTEGEATEVDKTVIERLFDPMVHLVRNSCDHGLENAEQRVAAGKPEAGTVRLGAHQSGGEVVITIRDDGRGIDRARVRAKAEANGLIQPDQVLSDQELLQLIFAPGFSTAAQITNLSGRGVGMDVVKRTIEGLRGTIDIQSVDGQGSTISLRIPLTLAIIDGLLVRVGASRYVIPLTAVEECLELSLEDDMRHRGRSLITLREKLVPFLRLRELFASGTKPDPYQKIVVVATGQGRVGLVVDQIIGNHQTVIKPMSPLHRGVSTFAGATILGDGEVALILDIAQLVAAGQPQEESLRAAG